MKFCILLFVVGCSIAPSSQLQATGGENLVRTRAIAIISRHSDRSTEYTFPNDPHPPTDLKEWPLGQGRLLPKGRQRIAKLAELIRSKYPYLFANIMPREVIARASGSQRVIDTGKALTSAITGIPDIPVTVDERLLRDPPPDCPARNAIKKQIYDREELEKYQKSYEKLFEYVSKFAGKKVKTIEDAYEIFDTLKVERENNKTLPAWVTEDVYNQLKDVRAAYACVNSASENQMRYQLGLFLSDLQTKFGNISDGESCVRYLDYKTHDTEISMLQRMLGVFEVDSPAPYLAAHVFELNQHAVTGESYIQSYYVTLEHDSMQPIVAVSAPPSCTPNKLCPADSYFNGLQKFMLTNATRAQVCDVAKIQRDKLEDFDECFNSADKGKKKGVMSKILNYFGK